MRTLPLLFTSLAAMTLAPAAVAQDIDAARVVAEARRAIAARYVLPDVAAKLDAALAAGAKAGCYRGLTGEALAARVNADMAAVTPDKHLGMSYDPRLSAMLAGAPLNDAADDTPPPGMARMMVRMNGGVRQMEVLPGNIRYLAYDGFAWGTPEVEAALRTGMAFLKGGDAYIIDISRNGGGSPGAVAAMASYFVPEGTPLMRFEMRGRPADESRAPKAPFSLAGKPLFVVTGGASASAAEEFATHVKALGFGRLVGGTTAGAGFRNDLLPLPGGYVLSVSTGRAVSLKTGKDWERVGVAPDVATSPDAALPRAKQEAMAAVLAAAPAEEKADGAKLLAYYRALATPVALARPAAAYAGRFGDRTVTATAQGVTMQRDGRPPMPLVPTGADAFVMRYDPMVTVRFVGAGAGVTAVEVAQRDGSVTTAERVR
jgi:hypothetical protein